MSLPFSSNPSNTSPSGILSFIPPPIKAYTSSLRDSFTQKLRRSGVLDRISHLTGANFHSINGYRVVTSGGGGNSSSSNSSSGKRFVCGIYTRICSVQCALIALWVITLYWGERKVWKDSIRSCAWGVWEEWPSGAAPHHVALIADPQLVDAHTYPGRGWPLSSLTEFYTDTYLYRGYTSLQSRLRPDTTIFLGDLFDGGREWATADGTYKSPEERFQHYGEKYWESEYRRFVRLFFDTWKKSTGVSEVDKDGVGTVSDAEKRLKARRQQQRQIITSLPGNHDIGFSNGVNVHVRERFENWFGPVNRVDVIANHTFVSIDAPSLSAMDPEEREAAGEGNNDEIWQATDEFLNNVRNLEARAVRDELRGLRGETYYVPQKDSATEGSAAPGLPTVILSHIPFWREPATPCGPLREHYPEPKRSPGDQRNSIDISRGYQYQNVLTDWITKHIFDKAGTDVRAVYSGDDHDYCEIEHTKYAKEGWQAPKEITVKSASMAMGVRKPGFLLVSLWNPIDTQTGESVLITPAEGAPPSTIQNKLCILPDQLSIFIQYGYTAVLTAVVLLVRAILLLRSSSSSGSSFFSQSSRPRGYGYSNLHPLEDVLEDQPLLPLHRQTAHHSSLSTSSPFPQLGSSRQQQQQQQQQQSSFKDSHSSMMKTVSSPMTSNEALPSGQWGASSSSSAGHSSRKSSIGGRGRARSVTLSSGGKSSSQASPIRTGDSGNNSVVTKNNGNSNNNNNNNNNNNSTSTSSTSSSVTSGSGGKTDTITDGSVRPHSDVELKYSRISTSPAPSAILINPINVDQRENAFIREGAAAAASSADTVSHTVSLGSDEVGAINEEGEQLDPFGPSSGSPVNRDHHLSHYPFYSSLRRSAIGKTAIAAKVYVYSPLKPVVITGGLLYLFLLWTW
ncbi:hypothetical protein KEM54_000749 [Ascosphaera aggregata]|nr:hypothetical protein KEM54_000749 [Ascosphaera aggregata]